MNKTKFLCLATMFLLLSYPLSAHDCEVDGIYYNLNPSEKTATITWRGDSYDSYENEYTGNIVIPNSISYNGAMYNVTSIGYQAFVSCSSLTSIVIPDGVTSIQMLAFHGCSGLSSVTFGSGITNIMSYAFNNCSSLTSIVIPNGVTVLGGYAFRGCSGLSSVIIPEGVTGINNHAFDGCTGLTTITCHAILPPTMSDDVFDNVDKTIPLYVPKASVSEYQTAYGWSEFSNILPIEESFQIYYEFNVVDKTATVRKPYQEQGEQEYTGDIVIPEMVIYNGETYRITSIGEYAFENCHSLTSITIPNSISSIKDYAFNGCSSLTSIDIPASVVEMHTRFSECSSLANVNVDENNPVYSSEDGVMYNKAKTVLLYYPMGKTELYFYIPNNVVKVANIGFENNHLQRVFYGENIEYFHPMAFNMCPALLTISAYRDNPRFKNYNGDGCLYNHDRTKLLKVPGGRQGEFSIPNGVITIDSMAIAGSSITNVIIPNTVENIEWFGLGGLPHLTELTLPSSIKKIDIEAFGQGVADFQNQTVNLSIVYIFASIPPANVGNYYFCPFTNATIYVPYGCAEAYKNTLFWNGAKEIIEMAPEYDIELSISSAGYATFYSDKAIQLPEDVTAYYGKLSDGNEWLDLYEIAGGKVPASTAVVLKAEPGTYGAWYVDETVAKINGNSLFGYTSDVPTSLINSIGFDVYTLAQENGVVGFYKYTGETLHAGKAFLRMDQSAKAPKMRIMGSETDIEYISSENNASKSVVYDLQGRRVNDMSRKGIYVVNGKKVVVR